MAVMMMHVSCKDTGKGRIQANSAKPQLSIRTFSLLLASHAFDNRLRNRTPKLHEN